jgi:hypothetical protein
LGNFALDTLPQKRDSIVGGVERSMSTSSLEIGVALGKPCVNDLPLLGRVPIVREAGLLPTPGCRIATENFTRSTL